jgi:predicted metal-dependent HD superfamily phosphohydrolase
LRPPASLDALQRAWRGLVAPFGAERADVIAVFEELARAYAHPERHYHTLDHVRDMLAIAEQLQAEADNLAAVRLAAWFHDAVYDPRAADNEERSADLASARLERLGLPVTLVATARRLIVLTKTHAAAPGDRDAAVLLDADLAILGAEPAAYRAYAQAIRREYAWVPDAAYRRGRSQVLQSFLGRDRIYRTPPLFEARERQARANLAEEIALLEEGLIP